MATGTQKIELTLSSDARQAFRKLTKALESLQKLDNAGTPAPSEYHDDNTLFKVRNGLQDAILTNFPNLNGENCDQIVTECISAMQNKGILFRERKN